MSLKTFKSLLVKKLRNYMIYDIFLILLVM